MSLEPCRETSVRLPSGCEKTRCEVPRSACSTKSSFCKTRISFRAFTLGNLGMHQRAFRDFRHWNRLEQLHAEIFRNRLFVSDQTAQIDVDRIAHHFARFLDRLSPRVATLQSRHKRVISSLIGFNDDAIRIVHTIILHGFRRKTIRHHSSSRSKKFLVRPFCGGSSFFVNDNFKQLNITLQRMYLLFNRLFFHCHCSILPRKVREGLVSLCHPVRRFFLRNSSTFPLMRGFDFF